MSSESSAAATDPRMVARISGWAALVFFFGISATRLGFYVSFHPPFTRIDQGEATFWLGSTLVLAPAALVLGYGYSEHLGRLIIALSTRLLALTPREKRLGLLALGLVAVSVARLGNEVIMLGYPVTDDEWGARFGGQMLAKGRAMLDLPFRLEAFPWLFMFVRGNSLTSMDWFGTQIAWAISELTHTGNWVFALSAAVPVPCIAYALSRRLSANWGVLGAAFFLVSPMAFSLSVTMHGHLHSRAFLALMLAAHVWGTERQSRAAGALRGLALGLALICRPFESAFFALPLVVGEGWEAFKEGGTRRQSYLLGFAVALVPLLVFIAHSHWVTGGWLPPRHTQGHTGMPEVGMTPWQRFGGNAAFNLMRLGVWFAGPTGIALAILGVSTDRFTRLIALGIPSGFALGFFHENFGIHAVGPIHYSEFVVPLTILAVHGLANVTGWVRARGLDHRLPVAVGAVGVVFFAIVFDGIHGLALNDSSHLQADIYERIEQLVPAQKRPAIVLAPKFSAVWTINDAFMARGSWVFEWKRPDPDFADDLIILRDDPEKPEVRASVRAAFPKRAFFRMRPAREEALLELVPLE